MMVERFTNPYFVRNMLLQFVAMYIASGYVFFVSKSLFFELGKDVSPSASVLVIFSLTVGSLLRSFVCDSILKIKTYLKESPSQDKKREQLKRMLKYVLISLLTLQLQLTTMEMFFPSVKGFEFMSVPFFFPFFVANACMVFLFFTYLKK